MNWKQAFDYFFDLPVYYRGYEGWSIWYAPGSLVLLPEGKDPRLYPDLYLKLKQAAQGAQEKWNQIFINPYTPLALTLYLHNRCHLRCVYCFTDHQKLANTYLSPEHVENAARLVARNCQKAERPFQVIFHGGGEPTRSQQQMKALLYKVKVIAQEEGVAISTYIATNGVISTQKAYWLSANFNLIGLSCDGARNTQAFQRPMVTGANSLPYVERTARIFQGAGTPFHLRMTVTNVSLPSLEENVLYVCKVLRPSEIHIEPEYTSLSRSSPEFSVEQVSAFVSILLRAKQVAAAYGVRLETSGTRISNIHGPFCNVLRPVLSLLPDGSVSGCFKLTDRDSTDSRWLGAALDHQEQFLFLNQVEDLRRSIRVNLETCSHCFNAFHCVRDCPDGCLVLRPSSNSSFRCNLYKALADDEIMELAKKAIASGQSFVSWTVK